MFRFMISDNSHTSAWQASSTILVDIPSLTVGAFIFIDPVIFDSSFLSVFQVK